MTNFNWESGVNGDWGTAADWGGAVPNAATANATISAAGAYEVTIDSGESFVVNSVTLNNATATLDVMGTLNLGATSGGTVDDLVIDAGVLIVSGAIADGTIVAGAGSVTFSDGAVLDDITYKGSLALATGTYIYVEGGLKVETPSGASPGTIDLTAEGQTIYIEDNEDLNNVVINLGSNASGDYYDDLYANDSTGALTFGSAATIISNDTAGYNYLTGYTIINDGQIGVASGEFYLESNKFSNAGTANIGTGGELILYTTGFTNSGVIDVSGGILDVDAALSLSTLGDVSISPAGVLDVSSTLFLGGGTLAVQGSQNFEISGTIEDGTIVPGAGTVSLSNGALLDDITYKGSLAFATGTGIDVEGGLKVETPSGTSPGTINLTAESQGIYVEDGENLNNVVINLGSNASGDYYDFVYANDSTGALTFGSAATIISNDTAGYNYLPGYTIINDGHISVASGELYLESNTFSNAGTMNIATGGELVLYTAGFTNSGVIDVNGGILDVGAALSLSALGDVSISSTGLLDVSSTLFLGGGSLAVQGSQNFEISGTIEDGTIVPGASSVTLSNGAVLDDITYKGSLALATGTYIYVEGGLKVETPSGASPGTINLTAEGQGIYVEDSENLNNVVINLGSNASGDYYDFVYANDSTGALTFGSAATIVSNNTAGYNYLPGYTIINDGQISVASGELYLESNIFSNAGTINIATGGELVLYTTGFTNSGVIDVSGGILDVGAALSLSALGDVSISPAGVLDVSSTLFLGGGTLAVHGSQNFEISGTIEDGVIVPGAGTVSLTDGAVLDDITYKGSLALATGTYIYVEGGLKVQTPSGASPGTINLTAEGQGIYVEDSENLNNVVINLGSNASGDYYDFVYANDSTGALTLGSAATIVSNNTAGYNYLQGYTILNDGHISVASGELYLESNKFTNAGTANIGTGGELILYTTGFTNSGVIDVSGGILDVDAALSLSALGDVSISPTGVLDVSSTLFLGGGTLAVHGSQNFEISGTVEDGTIVPGAGSVILSDGAVLDDITYKGSLALATGTYIYVEGGLKVETPSGASPGTIDLTAEGQSIYIEDNEDLNHVVINLGSNASGDYYDDLDAQDSLGTLTLGSAATIISNNTAGYNYLTGYPILNDGQISIATGEFYINPTMFTNAGTINVEAGALLYVTPTTLVNKGIFEGSGAGTSSIDLLPATFSSYLAGTLISGGFEANAGDTLALDIENTGSIVIDDGVLILNGAGSEIETYNNTTTTYTLIETSLQTIGSTGTFEVIGGRNETIGHTLDVAGGELVLGGGTFTATKLTLAGSKARLFGFGTVQDSIANAGTITANGGLLDITGAITGAGKLVIDAAATLELGGTSAEAVSFAGAGALTILKLETPTSYTGKLSVPTGGAVIDIADTTVNSATLSGTSLMITLAGGTTLDYHLAATLAGGVITVTPDGGTGSDITFYQQAAASAASPNPVNFGDAHVGTALSQFLTIANTRAAGGYSEGLDVRFSGTSSDITDSGIISLLAGGATNSSSLKVTLASGASGSFSGDAVITLSSDGTGTDGYGTTSLGSQTIAVEGKLFNLASPTLASNIFNFGVVHVGQNVADDLTLSNGTTLAAYTETLDASLGGASSGVEASGSIAVAAGGSNISGLSVGLNTGASGSISGTAMLTLVSNGAGIDTLGTTSLGSAVIDVTGTVDNYATLAIEKTAGTGTLTMVNATQYTLNLGSVTEGAAAPTVGIGALNAASGTADLLNGSFSLSGTADFTNSGFGAYSGEAAGHADTSPTISLGTGALGTYTETIVVYGTGSNASGYSGALTPETLKVTGTVVAAPGPELAAVGSVNPDFSAMNFISPGHANEARPTPVPPASDGFKSGLTELGAAPIAFQRFAGTVEATPSLAGSLDVSRFQMDHAVLLGGIPTGWSEALAPPPF